MLDSSNLTDQERIIIEFALTNLRLAVFDYDTARQDLKDDLIAKINQLRQDCNVGLFQEADEIKHLLNDLT